MFTALLQSAAKKKIGKNYSMFLWLTSDSKALLQGQTELEEQDSWKLNFFFENKLKCTCGLRALQKGCYWDRAR